VVLLPPLSLCPLDKRLHPGVVQSQGALDDPILVVVEVERALVFSVLALVRVAEGGEVKVVVLLGLIERVSIRRQYLVLPKRYVEFIALGKYFNCLKVHFHDYIFATNLLTNSFSVSSLKQMSRIFVMLLRGK
jgi:hypothetical protein